MSKNYTHVQSTPSDVWAINHGLGALPNVDVIIEENGIKQKVLVDRIQFVDENNIEIRFSTPRQGTARATTLGSIPFPAYDAFSIFEGYYNNYQFPELGQAITVAGGSFSTWTVCPVSGALYVMDPTADNLRKYTSLFDQTLEATYPITNYLGSIAPKYSTMWNGIFYYINNDTNSSSSQQDRTVYWYDTVNEIEGSFGTGVPGQDGITCDGTYLYVSSSLQDRWRKYDMSTYTEVEQITNSYTNIAYDYQSGYFYANRADGDLTSSRIYIYDSFGPSMTMVEDESLSLVNTQYDDLLVYGSDLWAVGTSGGGVPMTRTWQNELGVDETLSPLVPCVADGTTKAYDSSVHIIHPNLQDGHVYTMNISAPYVINVHESLVDDTVIDTINVTGTISGAAVYMTIWDGIAHVVMSGAGYSYYRIDLSTGSVLTGAINVSKTLGGVNASYIGLSVYRNELIHAYSVSSSKRYGFMKTSLDFTSAGPLDVDTSSTSYIFDSHTIDPITGYSHIRGRDNNSTEVHLVYPYIESISTRLLEFETYDFAHNRIGVYGGKLFSREGRNLHVEKSLYNNPTCNGA